MNDCLICKRICKSNRSLSLHLSKSHNITRAEYNKLFNLNCLCEKCKTIIPCTNKQGKCNICRDRTGENNPFYNKHHSEQSKLELSKKCSIAIKEKWLDKDYREKVIRLSSKPRNPNFGKEQSSRVKKWFNDNPIQKEIRSIIMKKSWEDGLIVKNGYSCNSSHLEKQFFQELKEININLKEKYTIKIGKKWLFPDIIDIDKRLIIEFFGDYWHCNPEIYKENYEILGITSKYIWNNDNIRIQKLKSSGYNVIIVWESDYKKDKNQVLEKIKPFIN